MHVLSKQGSRTQHRCAYSPVLQVFSQVFWCAMAPKRKSAASSWARAQAVAYVRTSSKANKDRGGKVRAKRVTASAAASFKMQIKKVLHDVVSGTLPINSRTQLKKLFEQQCPKNVN